MPAPILGHPSRGQQSRSTVDVRGHKTSFFKLIGAWRKLGTLHQVWRSAGFDTPRQLDCAKPGTICAPSPILWDRNGRDGRSRADLTKKLQAIAQAIDAD